MSLIDVHSAATAGIADALIAAEAMRTSILLIIELHTASCCEESYNSASPSSIARESFRVPLWLPRINLGLEGKSRRFRMRRKGLRILGCGGTQIKLSSEEV